MDVQQGKLILRVGAEKQEFNVFKALKYPLQDSCFKIEVLDEAVQEVFQREASSDKFEACI